ncbi:hypothetical protein [Prosthecobacter sp.]|uniref:hypothetical protein n=1 Tax=Prosthecobacter sp. TaxID=1965333 RepID=UPI003783DC1E
MLIEELARAPEGVARVLLTHLRQLMPSSERTNSPGQDHFQSYWSQFYGSFEGAEWNEPAELPFEKREAW